MWWAHDYAYVVGRQVEGLRHHRGAGDLARPLRPRAPTVVLVPGVYESWTFLRALGQLLHAEGHAVRVLPTLGYNRAPVPDAASMLRHHLTAEGLEDVVVVAHSKGGLIGKLAMLQEEVREGAVPRIAGMVAIATPFAGSVYARWVPLRAVQDFVPTNETLRALDAEREVNARIVSVYSHFDPHIPSGSALVGAEANVELATPGHFRLLADPDLPQLVLSAVRRLGGRSHGPRGDAS